jgi:hypothetical protein
MTVLARECAHIYARPLQHGAQYAATFVTAATGAAWMVWRLA